MIPRYIQLVNNNLNYGILLLTKQPSSYIVCGILIFYVTSYACPALESAPLMMILDHLDRVRT